MNRFLTFFVFLFAFTQLSVAQELGYGIRVGLNFNKLNGPSEVDIDGNKLETFDFNTGFHVGGVILLKFTDLFGVRAGVFYSQRGMKYKYEGPSFQFFTEELSGDLVNSTGDRRYRLTVSNSYIEIPLTAYYKFGERFEVHGGFLVGFLVASRAVGEFDYKGAMVPVGNDNIDFIQNLDFDYKKDQPRSPDDIDDNTPVIVFPSANDVVRIPETVGAYYMDFPVKDGDFYNTVDFGLTGGFSVFLNGGLFIMFSGNWGLVDATNDFYDISRYESDGLEYIQRNDKDYNVSLQTSIGFSF